MFSICKNLIGSKNNLVVFDDDSIKWSDTYNRDFLIISKEKEACDYLRLYNIDVNSVFDRKYVDSMKHFKLENIPWRYIIPRNEWFSSVKTFLENIKFELKNKYLEFFLVTNLSIKNYYKPNVLNLQKLKDSSIKLKNFLEKHSSEDLRYNRSSHKTGRLTVTSGPNYLTLEKKYKKLLMPSQKEYLISIDLISLEPRVLMLSQNKSPLKDVYLSIINDLGLPKEDRSKVKIYTLASMYSKDFSLAGNSLKSKLVKYFSLPMFKEKLIKGISDKQIFNFFGRPISVNDKEINNVINYYIQSTAADVSLWCFSEIVRNYEILPTCIIHDEIICEVDQKTYNLICENDFIEVPNLGKFYYSVEIINKKV